MSESEGGSPFAGAERSAAPPAPGKAQARPKVQAATSTTPAKVELAKAEVSIPESVVSPLIGAGANVYILTNELTQTVREKLGISWPFLQDTLNSRCAKLVAGGLLSSLAAIIFYKILKRLSQGKPPGSTDVQWGTKTYDVTPFGEKRAMLRSEGDAGAIHMLPHKIQLPQNSISHSADPEALLCKARDGQATSRNRHTRRREPGKPPRGDPPPPDNPWHTEHQHRRSPRPEEENPDPRGEPECRCPSELCGVLPDDQPRSQPLQPRLLYSVRESRVVQRAMDMADPRMVNMLTYSSCPAALCQYPAHVGAAASSPTGLYYPASTGSPQIMPCAGAGAGVYVPETMGHPACPVHAAQAAALLLQQRSAQNPSGGSWENRDEGQNQAAAVGASAAELHDVQNHQRAPIRTAANSNPASASCYTTSGATPALRPDHTATHLHAAASCPTVSTFPSHLHSHHPQTMVFHTTPHGTVVCRPAAYSDEQQQMQFQHIPYHHHHHSADADNQSPQPQQPMVRAQHQQPQQQQQPVVQQPSDSNISQVSSTVSQDSKKLSESGLSGQVTAPPDVVPREILPVLRQQEAQTQGTRHPTYNTPLSAAHHAPLAIADYAHNEFPWRLSSAQQGYQPSPVYMFGLHPDGYHPHHHLRNQPTWLAGPKGFMMPMPAGPQGMMFASSPAAAGLYGPSSPAGLYPSSHPDLYQAASFPHHHHGGFYPSYYAASPTMPGHAMLGGQHFQNPFFFSVPPDIAKSMGYQPNFNLSNSNPHIFKRKPAGGEGRHCGAPGSGNSSRICVVEPDNVSTNPDKNKPDIAGGGDKAAVDLKESTLAAMEDGSTKLESFTLATPSEVSPEASHPSFPPEDPAPITLDDSSELYLAFQPKPAPPEDDSPPFRRPVAEMFNPQEHLATDMPQSEVFGAASEPNDDIVAFPTPTDAASAASDHTKLFSVPEGSNASRNNDVFLSCIGEEAVEIVDAIDYNTYDSVSSHALHPQDDGMETQL